MIVKELGEGKLDIHPVVTSVTAFNVTGKNLDHVNLLFFDEINGIIAKKQDVVTVAFEIFGVFTVEIAVLLGFIYMTKCFILMKYRLDFFDTFRFLVGQTSLHETKKLMFLLLVTLSMTYFSENLFRALKRNQGSNKQTR